MRAVSDAREVVCEFKLKGRSFRLILPHSRGTFEVERLVRDEWRHWIRRWEPFGLGAYQGTMVTSSSRDVGRELPPSLIGAIHAALAFVQQGPLHGPRMGHA